MALIQLNINRWGQSWCVLCERCVGRFITGPDLSDGDANRGSMRVTLDKHGPARPLPLLLASGLRSVFLASAFCLCQETETVRQRILFLCIPSSRSRPGTYVLFSGPSEK